MSLLDKASLIVTPNAYKESKLYSVVPSSGAGDMNVVRATTATRVNSAGLIEVVPRNLLTYSNTFSNAVWGNGGYGNIATVIANDIISPDGLMNGSKITFSAGVTQARLIQQTPVINGGIYQASIFVKYGNKNTIDFYCDAAITGLFATFNFTTKVLTASGVSNTIVTELPNGWFRLQYTYTAPSATSQIGFISNIGADGFVYAYGGQAEQGSTATEYFPTTTRLNIPRIDYTNGSCPSLLVEPQRSNLFLSSQQFDDANWVKAGGTITANVAISPDGTQNADLFNNANIYQQRTQANNTTYCFSVYVKKNTASNIVIGYIDNVVGFVGGDITYTYLTNTITVSQSANGSVSGQAIDVGNGWIRLILKYTTIATVTFNYQLIASNGSYVYGAQLEVGSYATSLIPTQASSVTRNADVISKTGISSLIGQTEGTIFCDVTLPNTSANDIFTFNNSGVNDVFLASNGGNLLGRIYYNGNPIFFAQYPITSAGGRFKMLITYKSGNSSFYVNGTLLSNNTTSFAFTNTLSTVNLTNAFYAGANKRDYNSVQLYKTALTNAECIALTTL
jgi:hypothetical protein